jgi:hypothetical protein
LSKGYFDHHRSNVVAIFNQGGHSMETILAQLIGGLAGGAASGKLVKDADLGQIGNLIAGGIGGVGGGQLLGALLGGATGDAAAGLDIAALAGQLVGGGVAGAIVQVVVGMIKNKLLARS